MKTHRMRIWPGHFEAITEGLRRHLVVPSHLGCGVGDVLVLDEYDPVVERLTGARIELRVSALDAAGVAQLPDGVCALSMIPVMATVLEAPFSPIDTREFVADIKD